MSVSDDGWRQASTASGYNSAEIRGTRVCRVKDCAVEVRDSAYPAGPVLHFTAAEWIAFCQGAKAGEFDNL